jgi:intein/homing endonuclease
MQRAGLVWKRADEVTRGDLIVTVEECPDQGRTEVDGFALTEAFMELAGLYVGDGDGAPRTGLRFAIPEGPLQDYYASLAEHTFRASSTLGGNGQGKNRTYGMHSRKRHYVFTVGSKSAFLQFEALGLTGNARTKRVPEWVYSLSLPLRLAFLRGYVDSDGTVGKDGRLAFGACNKALIDDVRMLLVSCGVPVSNVTSDVGRMGNKGPIELHRFICGYPAYNRMVGSHDARYIDRLAREGRGKDGRYVQGVTDGVWNLELAPGLGMERVKSVDYVGEEEVYDLSTTGSHTFVALRGG